MHDSHKASGSFNSCQRVLIKSGLGINRCHFYGLTAAIARVRCDKTPDKAGEGDGVCE